MAYRIARLEDASGANIESQLRRALERREFALQFQPKVSLATGMITGAEALLRWEHPQWGTVFPEKFLAIAEHRGLIVPIGRWVLREACAQAVQWRLAGLPTVAMAVNISALEFGRPDFVEDVRTILADTEMDPRCLQLEITESALLLDVPFSIEILNELKKSRVQITVDDFGTGDSNGLYLKHFPVDVLKIARSSVNEIDSAADSGMFASALIGMGNRYKLRVVAKGVENQTQLAFLNAQNCEEGQGYFFSHPVVAEEFAALLEISMSESIVY